MVLFIYFAKSLKIELYIETIIDTDFYKKIYIILYNII